MQKKKRSRQIESLEESMKEIALVADLYESTIERTAGTPEDAKARGLEAKFARERILKLSLHARHLITELESKDMPR